MLSVGWVGLIQSVEDLNRKRLTSPGKKECYQKLHHWFFLVLQLNVIWTWTVLSTLPGSLACWHFLSFDLPASIIMSQFIKINLFTHTHTHTHTHPVGSISMENPMIQTHFLLIFLSHSYDMVFFFFYKNLSFMVKTCLLGSFICDAFFFLQE